MRCSHTLMSAKVIISWRAGICKILSFQVVKKKKEFLWIKLLMKYVLFFPCSKGRYFSTFYHAVFCKGSFQSKIPGHRTSHSLWIPGKLYSKQSPLMVEREIWSCLLHFLLAFRDYQPPQNIALLMYSFNE